MPLHFVYPHGPVLDAVWPQKGSVSEMGGRLKVRMRSEDGFNRGLGGRQGRGAQAGLDKDFHGEVVYSNCRLETPYMP